MPVRQISAKFVALEFPIYAPSMITSGSTS